MSRMGDSILTRVLYTSETALSPVGYHILLVFANQNALSFVFVAHPWIAEIPIDNDWPGSAGPQEVLSDHGSPPVNTSQAPVRCLKLKDLELLSV